MSPATSKPTLPFFHLLSSYFSSSNVHSWSDSIGGLKLLYLNILLYLTFSDQCSIWVIFRAKIEYPPSVRVLQWNFFPYISSVSLMLLAYNPGSMTYSLHVIGYSNLWLPSGAALVNAWIYSLKVVGFYFFLRIVFFASSSSRHKISIFLSNQGCPAAFILNILSMADPLTVSIPCMKIWQSICSLSPFSS